MFSYITKGVCSKKIDFNIVDSKLADVSFTGGCAGNIKGLSRLLEGMDIHEVITRLKGITCGNKPTSCPDQMAEALKVIIEKNNINGGV
jgi:uncharacterized protein (TIGR03905 family)